MAKKKKEDMKKRIAANSIVCVCNHIRSTPHCIMFRLGFREEGVHYVSEGPHKYVTTNVCGLYESLTVFFEASKASLLEVTPVEDLPL